ncbi:MAG: hypothetical protein LBK47_10340 [Prevotellaceae bacterium]|jgi:Tfp pilus assembly protein PilF|nr:hypothetical protein [Prevotellaceae bacterium]
MKNVRTKKMVSPTVDVKHESHVNQAYTPRFRDFKAWIQWYFVLPFSSLNKSKSSGEDRFKALPRGIFAVVAVLLFFVMPLMSLNAGNSGDEHYNYKHAGDVHSYYATLGADSTAVVINKKLHSQYYGQAFDNLTYLVNHTFGVDKVYTVRHIMNSLVGWLMVFFTGLLTVFLLGYRAGIFAMVLLFISPVFLGHSFNNPKDIPYAFACLFSTYHIFRLIAELPRVSAYRIAMNALGIGFAIAVRVGGLLQIAYLFMFVNLFFAFTKSYQPLFRKNNFDKIVKLNYWLALIAALGYIVGILYWPYALQSPLKNVVGSLQAMTHFVENIRQLFEGKNQWSSFLPWYYLPKYILMTTPVIVLLGLALFVLCIRKILKQVKVHWVVFVLFAAVFPVAYIIYKKSNVYGGWRHVLFVYPFVVCMAAMGIEALLQVVKRPVKWIAAAVLVALTCLPVRHIIANHPVEYIYYNELFGGVKKAYGSYEMDYYYHSINVAARWLKEDLKLDSMPVPETPIVIATNHSAMLEYFFRHYRNKVRPAYARYYERNSKEWDYAIYANSYIDAYQLQKGLWPPKTTIHTVDVAGKPVCTVMKRMEGKYDLQGIQATRANKPDSALYYLTKAVVLEPTCEMCYFDLIEVNVRMGRLDSAEHYVNVLAAVYPNSDATLNYQGWIFLNTGRVDDAARAYRKLIRNSERNPQGYIGLAQTLIAKQDYKKALEPLEFYATRIDGSNRQVLQLMYNLYMETDNREMSGRVQRILSKQ